MVDKKSVSEVPASFNLQFLIEEQFIMSKTGRLEDCEDSVYASDYFVAVIDGATSKSTRRWNDETSGRIASYIVKEAFSRLNYDATAHDAIALMTSMISDFYLEKDLIEVVKHDPVERLTVAFVAVNLWRREIWLVGDCQYLLDNEYFSNFKLIDQIAADARSLYLQSQILKGATVEELQQNDLGREYILPLLRNMIQFQNNPSAGEYRYSAVDGFPISDEGLIIQKIADSVETIILASDGYPFLKKSLEESEKFLQDLLTEDPLLCYKYKSTKGLRKGNVSYDDRAYVKLDFR